MQFRSCFGALLPRDKLCTGSFASFVVPLLQQAAQFVPCGEKPIHQLAAESLRSHSESSLGTSDEATRRGKGAGGQAVLPGFVTRGHAPRSAGTSRGTVAAQPQAQLPRAFRSCVPYWHVQGGNMPRILPGPALGSSNSRCCSLGPGYATATARSSRSAQNPNDVAHAGEHAAEEGAGAGPPPSGAVGGANATEVLSPALEERLRRHADRFGQLEEQLASECRYGPSCRWAR